VRDASGWDKMGPRHERMRAIETTRRRHRRRRVSPAASCVLALCSALVAAASEQTPPPPAGGPAPPPKRIVLSFEQRSRVEALTNPFRIDEGGPTRVLAFRTRLQVDARRLVGPIGIFVELQDARSAWNDAPFLVPALHENPLDFTQAFLRAGPARPFGGPLSGGLQLGRFTLDLGRRRLVARNTMRNTTNALEGAYAWLEAADGSSLQALFTRPVLLDPDRLDRSTGDRLLWGASLTLRRWPVLQTELYALRLDESAATATRRRFTTVGARLYRNPSPGHPDYELESAWQGGTVQGEDHDAVFAHVEGGFSFRPGRVRLALLYDYASGDADPDDGRSDGFDTLLGARAFEYAPTGIYGPFFRSNIRGPGLRVTVAPTGHVEIAVAHRALWLAEARDGWVGSGLRDPTGASGDALGQHLEARLRWRARHRVLVEARYAHFFKGSYLDRVPGSPRTPDSDYFAVGFELGGVVFAR
jgi:hypothetical protein